MLWISMVDKANGMHFREPVRIFVETDLITAEELVPRTG